MTEQRKLVTFVDNILQKNHVNKGEEETVRTRRPKQTENRRKDKEKQRGEREKVERTLSLSLSHDGRPSIRPFMA